MCKEAMKKKLTAKTDCNTDPTSDGFNLVATACCMAAEAGKTMPMCAKKQLMVKTDCNTNPTSEGFDAVATACCMAAEAGKTMPMCAKKQLKLNGSRLGSGGTPIWT